MSLELVPLSVDHAPAMVAVLADPSIYEFTGGTQPTLEELTARYARQTAGHSSDGSERWLNWVVLLDSDPVGYVQATVTGDSAEIAWVVSPPAQGRGVASAAARAMVDELTASGVRRLVAHVHPDHAASARVAERLGLRRTDVVEDGEVRWVRDDLDPDGFVAEWRAWHDAREERLRDPHGWLSITAIHWPTSVPQRFADAPGEWSADGARATVSLGPGETLQPPDGPVLAAGVHVLGPLDDLGVRLGFGDAVVQVAEREGRVILRPRHPDSPNLRAYRGTPCYPADPGWVVRGRFEPYTRPDGDAVGEVVFERDGAEHRLVAWGEDDGSLWILFRDATSGVTTYAALRQLVVEPPAQDGSVRIDFNRAFNMPCAYTDFATCPLPPPANTLGFAVEAGEQVPDTA
ncbi:GNAT family N-acetyltransferase [Nocardioides halotolerans]|uniref:GNAT family N-acetyltransferase n=1 Tax=Nocardioides halotolerans TaxID=433660 RepID=UPI000409BA94|nr:GNAT family N-acetyltransferase [Nocardioides halotolerans]